MKIKLFVNESPENMIGKTLTNEVEFNITLRRGVDVVSPELRLSSAHNLRDYNYMELVGLGRKYFITSIQSYNKNLWLVSGLCDFIETYKSEILNSYARVKRGVMEGDYQDVTTENSLLTTTREYVSNVSLERTEKLILTTIGDK